MRASPLTRKQSPWRRRRPSSTAVMAASCKGRDSRPPQNWPFLERVTQRLHGFRPYRGVIERGVGQRDERLVLAEAGRDLLRSGVAPVCVIERIPYGERDARLGVE